MCIDFCYIIQYHYGMRILKELVDIRTGYTFRSSIDSFAEGDTEVIQAGDLGFFFDHARRPTIKFPGGDKHLLKKGDILVSARGFSKATLFKEVNLRAVASSSLFVLTPKNRSVSSEYIAMFFNSEQGMRAVHGLGSGGSIRSITKENLGRVIIPEIPPDKERSLGGAVQAIDDELATMELKELYLSKIRESIISKTLKEAMK